MVGAIALILVGLCASDAESALLRRASPPVWTALADTPPIALHYRREPGRLVIGGARATIPLTPSATLFMQARKPI